MRIGRWSQRACGYVDAYPGSRPSLSASGWSRAASRPAGHAGRKPGATLVDEVEPFEQRKLWLLNGSHSMLAYAGSIRGYSTIDEAIADPGCRSWVEMFWDEASRHLTLPAADIAEYRAALLTRFSNPRAGDQLARIAADGSTKLLVRTLPTIRAERAAGRVPIGCATTRRRLGAASARAGRADQGRRSRCRSGRSQFW